MTKRYQFLFFITFIVSFNLCFLKQQTLAEAKSTILIDSILATVDGEPITLFQLRSMLGRQIEPKDIANDNQATQLLEGLIQRKMVELEAKSLNVAVDEKELDAQLAEIASRNGLSVEDLRSAIKSEGKNPQLVEDEIRSELLKSKVLGAYLKANVQVSEDEVDRMMSSAQTNFSPVTEKEESVTISQIFLDYSKHSKAEVGRLITSIKDELSNKTSFKKLAKNYSDGAESKEGGLLGTVSYSDLAPELAKEVKLLQEGEVSLPIESDAGIHIIKREKDKETKTLSKNTYRRESVRAALEQEKLEKHSARYFGSELPGKHVVEKNY
jgi:peptidyl-prolyl cis-trans isomerase SurA